MTFRMAAWTKKSRSGKETNNSNNFSMAAIFSSREKKSLTQKREANKRKIDFHEILQHIFTDHSTHLITARFHLQFASVQF